MLTKVIESLKIGKKENNKVINNWNKGCIIEIRKFG